MKLSKTTSKIILLALSLILLIGAIINNVGFLDANKIEFKLNKIISSNDDSLIRDISEDDLTYYGIKTSPKGFKIRLISDFQGVIEGCDYYVASLDDKIFDVFVNRVDNVNLFYRIFPQIKIYKIKIRES